MVASACVLLWTRVAPSQLAHVCVVCVCVMASVRATRRGKCAVLIIHALWDAATWNGAVVGKQVTLNRPKALNALNLDMVRVSVVSCTHSCSQFGDGQGECCFMHTFMCPPIHTRARAHTHTPVHAHAHVHTRTTVQIPSFPRRTSQWCCLPSLAWIALYVHTPSLHYVCPLPLAWIGLQVHTPSLHYVCPLPLVDWIASAHPKLTLRVSIMSHGPGFRS